MKLNKFLCLFVLFAVVFAFASCDLLGGSTQTETFEVKFDSKGGSEVPSQNVEMGALVTEPEAPTREGYTFDGWYLGGKSWNFAESTVTKSITLIAKWTAVVEKFDVTFDSQGGSAVDAQSVKKGGLIEKPLDPTKDGYNFAGWYNGEEKWDFTADKVFANVTLTAKWDCAHKDLTTLEAVAATCTTDGLTEGKKCNACGEITVAQNVIPAAHTVMIDNAVAPTCGKDGLTEGSHCTVCNEVLVAQDPVAATGEHTPGEAASCLVAETCTVCGVVLNPALGHTEVDIPEIPAACEKNGYTAGKQCSVCGVKTVEPTLVPALVHNPVTVDAVAPTCTETGLTAGKKCSICGIALEPQEEVAALGHTEATVDAVAPTCTETGLTAGVKCSVCNEVLVAQDPVAALGHTEGAAADCENAQICTVCNEILTPALGHTEATVDAIAPTCTETGLTAGVKCSVCNKVLVAQEPVAELGHTEGEEADCENAQICTVCKVVLTPALGHDYNESGECNRCGETISHKIFYYLDEELVYTGKFFENLGRESLDDVQVPGYVISGWTDIFGDEVTSIAVGTTYDIELYAVAEAIEYTITYIENGVVSTAMYTVSNESIALKSINSKDHFNTLGWMDENGNFVTELPAGTIGDFTFTAVFEEITYTITYNYNDGSEPVVVEFKFSALPELMMPANREGYLFQGWFADAEFGTRVTSLENASGDVVLYAQWTEMPGGTLTPEVPF